MTLRPGETVSFISLLDENGEVLLTAPMDHPISIPTTQVIANAEVDVKVNVRLSLKGAARR